MNSGHRVLRQFALCRFSAHLRPYIDASARVAAFVGRLFHHQTYVLFTKRYRLSADPVVVPLRTAFGWQQRHQLQFSWVSCSVVGIALANAIPSTGARHAGILTPLRGLVTVGVHATAGRVCESPVRRPWRLALPLRAQHPGEAIYCGCRGGDA
jgi:hypothetical protein